jgi:hypothetical protein
MPFSTLPDGNRIKIGTFKKYCPGILGNSGIYSTKNSRDTHGFFRITNHQILLAHSSFLPVECHKFRSWLGPFYDNLISENPVGVKGVQRLP